MNDILLAAMLYSWASSDAERACDAQAKAHKEEETRKAKKALRNYRIDLSKLDNPKEFADYLIETHSINEVRIWKNE